MCTTALYLLGRKLSLSPLQGRKGKMSSIETEVKKYWELLECENVTTRLAALRYAEARRQSSKFKVEHCVLLASKVYARHIAFACNFLRYHWSYYCAVMRKQRRILTKLTRSSMVLIRKHTLKLKRKSLQPWIIVCICLEAMSNHQSTPKLRKLHVSSWKWLKIRNHNRGAIV